MAATMYNGFKNTLGTTVDWTGATPTVNAIFQEWAATPTVTDATMAAVNTTAALYQDAQALTTQAGVTTGVYDATDETFLAVPTSGTAKALVVYYDPTGVVSLANATVAADTSMTPAIHFALGSGVTPNGGDITIQWNANGLWNV